MLVNHWSFKQKLSISFLDIYACGKKYSSSTYGMKISNKTLKMTMLSSNIVLFLTASNCS